MAEVLDFFRFLWKLGVESSAIPRLWWVHIQLIEGLYSEIKAQVVSSAKVLCP